MRRVRSAKFLTFIINIRVIQVFCHTLDIAEIGPPAPHSNKRVINIEQGCKKRYNNAIFNTLHRTGVIGGPEVSNRIYRKQRADFNPRE